MAKAVIKCLKCGPANIDGRAISMEMGSLAVLIPCDRKV